MRPAGSKLHLLPAQLFSLRSTALLPSSCDRDALRAPLLLPPCGVLRGEGGPGPNARGEPPTGDLRPRDVWRLRDDAAPHVHGVPLPFDGVLLPALTFPLRMPKP